MPQELQIIAQVPLFAQLPADELEHLVQTLETCHYQDGEVIFLEDERGDQFYVIREGQVEIIKSLGDVSERIVALRGPGEFVGEMSLFNRSGLRTASVRAFGRVDLWEMTRADFDELLKRQPVLVYEMLRVLSDRLNAAHNAAIRDLQEKNLQLEQAYSDLQVAQSQLIEQKMLEHEMQVAHDIQMNILPQELPVLPGFSFGAHLLPARSVGGDFYDFIPLSTGRIGIMIGDVTDKGIPAAIFMAQVHAFLRVEAERNLEPVTVLRNVNRHLMKMSQHGLFVTVLYGILDNQSGDFSYTRAGHELPLLCSPEHDAHLLPKSTGQPLGIFEEPKLDQGAVHLNPSSSLLLYTDGVTDEYDSSGNSYGLTGLMADMQSRAASSAQANCNHILQQAIEHLSGTSQDDDITLVAIHADPLPQNEASRIHQKSF